MDHPSERTTVTPNPTGARRLRPGLLVTLGATVAAIAAPAAAQAGEVGWNAPFEPRTSTELSYLDHACPGANDLELDLDPGPSPSRSDDRIGFHDSTDTVKIADYSTTYSESFMQCHEDGPHEVWCTATRSRA